MRLAPSVLAVAAACGLCGCSAGPTAALPKERVEGRVLAQGQPVPFVLVTFYSHDPADATRYGGPANKDGAFRVECPPGNYKVTITPLPLGVAGNPGAGALAGADGKGAKDLPAACRSRTTTPLAVDVPAGGKKDVTLNLP